MLNAQPIQQVLSRLSGYLQTQPEVVLLEFAIIWVCVFVIVRFLRGTRGASLIKAVVVLMLFLMLVLQTIAQGERFERLNYLLNNVVGIASIVLVVVFQPELRRALIRLGEARFWRQGGLERDRLVRELLAALDFLSRNKIGALIAIERQTGLGGIVDTGTPLDAVVTQQLLNTIFWPNSALHDMGVVIREDRAVAAGVQFPLAEGEGLPADLGSRHRAAIGLSQDSDAFVLVVSEETGVISVAEQGRLTRNFTLDTLRPVLNAALGAARKAAEVTDADADHAPGLSAAAAAAEERSAAR